MLGRKMLYTYGFLIFSVGSGLCALAPSLLLLDGFRVVQAVGAVMLQANSLAIITASLARDRLGRGIGVQGTAQALGLAFGPFVGGVLIGLGGWRLIFLVNIPIGVLGVVTAWLFVPRSHDLAEHEPFDWLGLLLFVPALTSLLLALSFGNESGWTSPTVASLIVLALVSGVGFLARTRVARHPLINLGLFRRRRFSVGISAGLVSFIVLFGVLFVTPFYLERSRHTSPGRAGALLTVLPLAMAVVAPFSGRLADKIGGRTPTIVGMLVVAGGLALAAVWPSTVSLLLGLALAGVGMGLFTPSNNTSIMSSVPARRVGVASGVLNMTRGLGTALGLSLTALVFDLATGGSSTSSATTHGFIWSMAFLAAAALVAATVSLLRRPRSEERFVE